MYRGGMIRTILALFAHLAIARAFAPQQPSARTSAIHLSRVTPARANDGVGESDRAPSSSRWAPAQRAAAALFLSAQLSLGAPQEATAGVCDFAPSSQLCLDERAKAPRKTAGTSTAASEPRVGLTIKRPAAASGGGSSPPSQPSSRPLKSQLEYKRAEEKMRAIQKESKAAEKALTAARNALEASAEKQALTSAQLRLTIAKKAEAEQLPGLRKQQQQAQETTARVKKQLIEQKKKRAEQAKRAKEKADREAAKRAEAARKAAALAKRK